MIDLQETIEFYKDLAKETQVRDSRNFYEQVAYWLEDYKSIKDTAVEIVESNMSCSCCGSKNLYEANICTTDEDSLTIKDMGDGDYPLNETIRSARCCRDCGNVMPYIRVK